MSLWIPVRFASGPQLWKSNCCHSNWKAAPGLAGCVNVLGQMFTEFVLWLWNWASRVKAVSHREVWAVTLRALPHTVSPVRFRNHCEYYCPLHTEIWFCFTVSGVLAAGMLFWRCFHHSQVLVQSVEEPLCPIPEKGQAREDGVRKKLPDFYSQAIFLALWFIIYGCRTFRFWVPWLVLHWFLEKLLHF